MNTFTKHILLLALMLFGVAGAAWALPRAPQKFTGPVDIYSLVQGDTLAPGFSITGLTFNHNLDFNAGRFREGDGTPPLVGFEIGGNNVTGYGDNSVIIAWGNTYFTPWTGTEDGNAWLVTGKSSSTIYLSGIYVAPDPYAPALDETTGYWNFLMPGQIKLVNVEYYDSVLIGANVTVDCDNNYLNNIAYGYRKANGDTVLYFSGNPVLSLTATAPAGYAFDGWSDGITDNPRTVTLSGDTAFLPLFYTPRTLTLNQSAGGTLALDGITEPSITASQLSTSMISGWNNDQTSLSADDLPGFVPVSLEIARGWQGFPQSGFCMLFYNVSGENWSVLYFNNGNPLSPSDMTYLHSNAYNALEAGTTIYYTTGGNNGLPAGVIAKNADGSYQVKSGTELNVIATPDPAHYLAAIGNEAVISNSALNYTYTMPDANTTLAATFEAKPTLTLASNDIDQGLLLIRNERPKSSLSIGDTLRPGDYITGISSILFQGNVLYNGEIRTFYNNGYGSGSVLLDYNCELSFFNGSYILRPAIDADHPGNAWVVYNITGSDIFLSSTIASSQPIVNNVTASTPVGPGTDVTIVALPADNHHLQSWSNGYNSTSTTQSITMGTADSSVTAIFDHNPFQVAARANRAVGGTVSAQYSDYPDGNAATEAAAASISFEANPHLPITLTATPAEGFHFTCWTSAAGDTLGTGITLSVTDDADVVAVFDINTYTVTLAANNGQMGSVAIESVVGPAANIGDITLYESNQTTSINTPTYTASYYNFTRSQYIIPAADLADIPAGTSITGLKYYIRKQGGTTFPVTTPVPMDVYMAEVESATYTSSSPYPIAKETSTMVHQGTLSVGDAGERGEMTIVFSQPYIYNGGDLVIGMENSEKSNTGFAILSFYSTNFSGVRCMVCGNNSTYENIGKSWGSYRPMTTLSYVGNSVTDNGDGTYTVAHGTQLTLKATANDGSHVAAWSNNAEVNSLSEATQTLTVTTDSNITANFAQNPTLTLAANGNGVVSIVDNSPAVTINRPQVGDVIRVGDALSGLTPGTTYSMNGGTLYAANCPAVLVKHNGATVDPTGNYYAFLDAYNGTSLILGTNYPAGDSTDGFIITSVNGNSLGLATHVNGVHNGTRSFSFLPGTVLNLVATADAGYHVDSWSNNTAVTSLTATPQTITIGTEDTIIGANFVLNPILTLASNEGGSVEMEGVSHQPQYYSGLVQCTHGMPDQDGVISGGGLGGFAQQTMTSAQAIALAQYMATQTNTNCAVFFGYGNYQLLFAKSDGTTGTGSTMGDYNMMGLNGYNIYYVANGTEAGSLAPEGVIALTDSTYNVLPGTEVSVIATPDSAHYFVNWNNGAAVNTNTAVTTTLTMGFNDTTVTANFAAKPTLTLAQTDGGSLTLDGYSPAGLGTEQWNNIPSEWSGNIYNFTVTEMPSDFQGVSEAVARTWQNTTGKNVYLIFEANETYAAGLLFYANGTPDEYSGSISKNMAANAVANGKLVLYTTGVHTEVLPAGVTAANATLDTFTVDYGADVTVIATPDSIHYLTTIDDIDTNCNFSFKKNYGNVIADITSTAVFAPKPVLTFTVNDTAWGKVSPVDSESPVVEDFASFTVGSKLAQSATQAGQDCWTTWRNNPGSNEDGIIANLNGNNCIQLGTSSDLVYLFGNKTSGTWEFAFDVYVPEGQTGYFNILHNFAGSGSSRAMQCYFNAIDDGSLNVTFAEGHGTLHAAGTGVADLPCVFNEWMHVRTIIDIDNNYAQLYFNNALMHTWQWDYDSFANSNVGPGLSAADFFTALGDGFYVDNISFRHLVNNGLHPTDNDSTFIVDYGTDVTVMATPNATHYLANFDGTDVRNDNDTATKTYTNITSDLTATANFTPKPVLTLVVSDTAMGSVAIDGLSTYIDNKSIAALSDSTYCVNYGIELNLVAKATELHHVANWVDADSVAYPADSIAYFNYFTTQPENLFPDSSTLTFTVTADTMAKAIFGINYRNLYFTHNEGGSMEFIVPQDITSFEGISQTTVSQNGITITANQADEDGMYLKNGVSSINISIDGDASITQVDFHVTNGANLVNTISVDATGATISFTDNNEYGSIMGLNTNNFTISSSTNYDLQIDQLIVHYGNVLPNGVAYGPNDTTWYVMPDSTVIVRAVPDDGFYLVSWNEKENISILDTLSVSMTITEDDTLQAIFAPNPVLTLAVNDPVMGNAYFTGFHGNTITRAGIIKAESVDLPYQWYEASEIMSIEGGNGMVTKDANSHYLTVSGVFNGTATVITSTGAFSVGCKPTLPNGVLYNIDSNNYTVMPRTPLSFTATAAPGHYFVDWAKVANGDSIIFSTEAVTTVTIDGDMKMQANFLHNPYRLTLAALPDSMGIVTEISSLPFTSTEIEQGWEDGMNGWTMNNCHSSTGISSSYTTNSGNNLFRFYYTTNYPQYLISPELDNNDGGTISFWYRAYSSNYTERFQVGYSTTTNDPSAFTFGEEVSTNQNNNFLYYENTFPAGTKYLCISCNSDDQFYLLLDDLTLNTNPLVASNIAVVPDTTTPNTYLVMADSTVTIVANANTGYHITGWSNNAEVNSLTADTIQVTMVSDSTITASFGNNPVVTLADNANGTLSIESLPAFAIDNQDGTYSVLPGSVINIVSTPDRNYYMTQWNDNDSIINSNVAVTRTDTIYADTTISASFAHKPILTLTVHDTAFGTVTIEGSVIVGVDNMFDNLVDVIAASSAWQYGVSTDGQYIYTSSWSTGITDGYIFHQYDQAGNLIDNFNIDGVTLCRDMTSDGQYIYGANGETVYVMDLAAHTLVNTIQFSGAGTVRHISYDPVRDAFWVGNWSSLMLYSRTGSFIQNGPSVNDVSGSAFYQDGEDHIILLCQPNSNAVVYDYNINQNTITQLIDITSAVGVEGSSGGSFIGYVNGKLYWLGDTQDDPNHISVYALDKGGVYALNDTTFIVDYNNDVTMRAAADTGYHFVNWQGSNNIDYGTADSLTVTMTMDTTVRAIFDTNRYTLTVLAADSAMGSVAGSRTATHFIDYEISATADSGYHFVAWNDGDTNNPRTVTLYKDSTFTATFDSNIYVLAVVSADTVMGTVSGSDSAARHFKGYEIISTPNYGYHFVNWSNNSTTDTTTVYLVSDSTFTAYFDFNQYTVSGMPATTTDQRGSVAGSGTVNYLDTVTLVATADSGYHFTKWVDANDTVLSTADTLLVQALGDSTVYAVFDTNVYNLHLVVADTCAGRGTVAGDSTAKHFLTYDISATANPGYHFVAWSDGDTNAFRTVSLVSDSTIAAIFDYNPSLTLVYDEQNGRVEFIVDNQVANLTGITGSTATDGGVTVTAESADASGMSVKNGKTITIVAASGTIINQVAFHLTNGVNRASEILASAGTVNATNGNAYGAITDVRRDTLVIWSESTKDINIDQFTIQYASELPDGVVHLAESPANVFHIEYNTEVRLLAVPADSSYLQSWGGDTTSTDDLTAVVNIAESDATVYINFSGNPVLSLTASGNGRVYFEGYNGYTVNRNETVLATNLTDFPYMWYEAGTIDDILGGNGMVTKDSATSHYVNVHGAFNGTATVVTTGGSFTVTCIPTVPNGITVMSLDTFVVEPGASVTVVGEAAEDHYLRNWNDLDDTVTVRNITVDYNTHLVANFLHNPYTLTVNVDTVMGSAAPEAGQNFVAANADGTYTVMADSTVALSATPDSGYHFVSWTEADSVYSTSADTSYLAGSDRAFTANIDTNVYVLTVLVADSQSHMGTVAGTDSTAKHFLGYEISATPAIGYQFISWSDGDSNATRTISLTKDSTLTATFDTIRALLAWSDSAFTGYTLIDFNSFKPTLDNPFDVPVRYGVVESGITIDTATGLLGDSVSYGYVTANVGTYHVYAVHDLSTEYFYDSVAYTLTVENGVVVSLFKNISDGGSVEFAYADTVPSVTHFYTGSDIMAFVAHDDTTTVLATPAEGYHFTKWQSGNFSDGWSDIAATAEYTYTVPDAIATGLRAVFDTNVYAVSVTAADTVMGGVNGPDSVKHFLSGTYVATPATGYHFTGWVNAAGATVSESDTIVVAPVSDTALYATFDTNTYTLTVLAADTTMGSVSGSQATVKHFLEYGISATPFTCHEFVAWDDSDSNASRTVTLTSDSTITAEFAYTVRASYDTVSACDTLVWNDSVYTVNNDYSVLLHTLEGCDSTANLSLTVKYSTSSLTTVTECENYTWHDITYTMSTLAHFDTVNAAGCDSIANLDLTINYSSIGHDTVVTCDTMYIWNGITYISSTIGTWHGTNMYGCDSTATLNLTLNKVFTGVDVQQHCDSYTWIDGVTYSESTDTPTHVFRMLNGCDSTVTLDLTISTSVTSTQTVSACDSYTWIDGVTYTESNDTATYSTSTSAGCDSVVTLNLTVNTSAVTNIAESACNYYIWDGVYYTNTGNYTKHYTTVQGCDSTVNLALTVNQPVSTAISDTACGGYTWNSVNYTASGAYSQTFTGQNGCDSTVTLRLTVKQPVSVTVTASACDTYEWNGTAYNETPAVAPTFTTTGSNGCDSVTTLNLTVRHATSGVQTVTACDSYTWIDGITYTSSTSSSSSTSSAPTFSTTNAAGCDSTVTLNLTVMNSVETGFEATACNYYIWDGVYYNESGSFTKHFHASNGCDSAVTLTLTVNQPVSTAISDTACGGYTWNSVNYNASGAYTQTFTGSNGCDSTVTLTLTVNQPTSATVTATACDSYEWHGVTYDETPAVAPTFTTTGSNGCDSVTTLQLVIAHSSTGVDNVTACDSYTWIDGVTYTASTSEPTYTITGATCNQVMTLNLTIKNSVENSIEADACIYYIWDGTYYNETGSFTKHYTAANGCDSTVTLALTVNQPVSTAISDTACVSYTWNGVNYTASGAYTQTFTGSNGCDSTVTLRLTVKQPTTATVTASACDSYEWHGVTYDETPAVAPTFTTTGSNGCDSVTTLNLTVRHATSGVQTVTACDSYTWIDGITYTSSTSSSSSAPTYTLTNAAGCDSTVTLNLTVMNSVETGFEATACNYYIWDGVYYNATGSYTKSYTAANGCDSTVTLALTVNQPVSTAISDTACGGYTWNGVNYTASGAYSRTFTGSNGCDSTVTLTLTVKQPATATVTASACDSYTWNGTTYDASGNYSHTTTGANGCDSVTTLNLTVRHATSGVQTVSACNSYTWIDGITYTSSTSSSSSAPTYTLTNAAGCDSTVTLHLTIKRSFQNNVEATACNFYIWDGTYYNVSGNYTKNYTAANGCDSTVTLALTVNHPVSTAISDTACGSYTWNGVSYNASGAYSRILTGSNGCDSTVTLTLTVKQPTSATVAASACDSYTWNGSTYHTSGSYSFTTTGSNGCDSTTTLQLTVRNATSGVENVVACDSYTWIDGITYTSSTSSSSSAPTYTLTNAAGCDSTVTLNLTVRESVEKSVDKTVCETYTWNGAEYNASGVYTQSFTALNGCDSTVTLTLTVNQPVAYTVVASACDSYTWHGVTYTETPAEAPTFTTTGSNGCDSVTTLQLTVAHSGSGVDDVTACDSYTWIDGVTYTETPAEAPTFTVTGDNCSTLMTLNLTINKSVGTSIETSACNYYIWDGVYYTNTGNYTKHYTTVQGCDSTVTLALTVNQPVSTAISDTACGGYTWNGVNYTASGAYSRILTGSNGCDSTVTLTLTVKQPTYATVTASACDSYSWNGSTYHTSGSYSFTTTGSNGCDSTTTLQLTVRNATSGVQTVTACNSYTWIDGITYTSSTSSSSSAPTYTLTNAAGCDSTVTLSLTVMNSVETGFEDTACIYYIWDGTYYTTSGSFTKNYTALNGCDSTVTLALTINQPVSSSFSQSACNSYTWNDETYYASGSYSQTFTGSNGCDSTVTMTLTVKQPTTATVTASACEGYTWNGTAYNASGDYTYTTTGSNGCDSVTTLHLTVNHATSGVENVVACDSYTWIDGITYTSSTSSSSSAPTYTLTNAAGCDSVITLHLTVNSSVETGFTAATCNYYIWDGTFYNETGSYTKHYFAANGCDSAATLTLTVNQPVTAAISATACGGYTWNDVSYTASGAYTQTFTGSNGCDSTVTLTLTVNQPTHATVTVSACGSYTWNGSSYTNSGSYSHTTTGSNGCDSVTTLQLTVNQPTSGVQTVTACDSYTWIDGITYTSSTSSSSSAPTYTLTNAAGCDSVITLHLTVNNSVTHSFAEAACSQYVWDGSYYTASGTYTKHYTAANGCDSTAVLTLTVNQPVTAAISATACGSHTWNNVTYTASGTYTQTFTGSNGCDSTVTLTLTVNQPTAATVTASACESYTWNGTTYTSSGSYTHTATGANGCDSVTTLQLTVNHATTGIETVTACDSYTWIDGITYTSSTSSSSSSSSAPTYTLTNAAGCDSTVTLNLTVNYSSEGTETVSACESYEWNGQLFVQSGTYTFNTTNAAGCDSVATLELTVNYSTFSVVHLQGEGNIVWNGETFTESGVYERTLTNAAGCDSLVTLVLAILPDGVPMPYLYNIMDVMLTINHYEPGMENVRYEWYRWYRDGELVLEGPDKDSYSEGGSKLNGCYYLEVATDQSLEYWVRSNEVCIGNVAIEDAAGQFDITLAPNPVLRGRTVTLSAEAGDADFQGSVLQVFDEQGRSVLKLTDTCRFEADFVSGMYLVRLTLNDGRSVVKRLIVK